MVICQSNMTGRKKRQHSIKAPTELMLVAKPARSGRCLPQNPLICIPLDLKAKCKIQHDFLGERHYSIKTSDVQLEGSKWLTSANLRTTSKLQPEEGHIIFTDNETISCTAERICRSSFFFFLNISLLADFQSSLYHSARTKSNIYITAGY